MRLLLLPVVVVVVVMLLLLNYFEMMNYLYMVLVNVFQ
jgi:hypothetical protein